MNMKPLGDRIIIQPHEADEKSKGGIYLPDRAKERPQRGKVLAVGPGRYVDGKLLPCTLVGGEEVIFSRYQGSDLEVGNQKVKVIKEEDVLCVVEPGE